MPLKLGLLFYLVFLVLAGLTSQTTATFYDEEVVQGVIKIEKIEVETDGTLEEKETLDKKSDQVEDSSAEEPQQSKEDEHSNDNSKQKEQESKVESDSSNDNRSENSDEQKKENEKVDPKDQS